MSEIDLIILVILAISTVLGLVRGFIKAFSSIAVWTAAIAVTILYSSRLASILPIDTVQSPVARASISALVLFLGTLGVGALFVWISDRIFSRTGISRLNRFMGAGFGLVRGVILVTLAVLAAHLVPELQQEAWWNDSRLLPRFQSVAKILYKLLPENIRGHFEFPD